MNTVEFMSENLSDSPSSGRGGRGSRAKPSVLHHSVDVCVRLIIEKAWEYLVLYTAVGFYGNLIHKSWSGGDDDVRAGSRAF